MRYVNAGDYVDLDNASDGLTAAFADAATGCRTLFIPPGRYMLYNPVNWTNANRVDVYARDAFFYWYGSPSDVAVTYSGIPSGEIIQDYPNGRYYESFKFARFEGLGLFKGGTQGLGTGLCLTNIITSNIDVQSVRGFETNIRLYCNHNPIMYNRFRFQTGYVAGTTSIEMDFSGGTEDNCCLNRNAVYDSQIGGTINVITEHNGTLVNDNVNTWSWFGCSFEQPSGVFLQGKYIQYWAFTDCWFEGESAGSQTWDLQYCGSIVIRGGVTEGLHTPYPNGVTTDESRTEFITNGNFATSMEGWETYDTVEEVGGDPGTFEWDSGTQSAKVVSAGNDLYLYETLMGLTIGQTYDVSVNAVSGTPGDAWNEIRVGITSLQYEIFRSYSHDGNTYFGTCTYTFSFTATATTVYLSLRSGNPSGHYTRWDNVSVTEQ
jgi:hypothetical protein